MPASHQIVVPQDPRRDRTPGSPGRRQPPQPIAARSMPKALDLARCPHESQIAIRPHIGSPQSDQEVDVGRPRTDSTNLEKRAPRGRIVSPSDAPEIKLARFHEPGQIVAVRCLLARKAVLTQVAGRLCSDALGRHPPHAGLQPRVGRSGRRQGNLLLEYDADERREAGSPAPQRRWTAAVHCRGEIHVTCAQLEDTAQKGVPRELPCLPTHRFTRGYLSLWPTAEPAAGTDYPSWLQPFGSVSVSPPTNERRLSSASASPRSRPESRRTPGSR